MAKLKKKSAAEPKDDAKEFASGSLVNVADPVTGVHGMRVVRSQDGEDLIVSTIERPDLEERVAASSATQVEP